MINCIALKKLSLACGRAGLTAKIFSPQRTQSAQRKIFVFFVTFVVQFWLRPKPRYVFPFKINAAAREAPPRSGICSSLMRGFWRSFFQIISARFAAVSRVG